MSKMITAAAQLALAGATGVVLVASAEARKRFYWNTDANGYKIYVCSILNVPSSVLLR